MSKSPSHRLTARITTSITRLKGRTGYDVMRLAIIPFRIAHVPTPTSHATRTPKSSSDDSTRGQRHLSFFPLFLRSTRRHRHFFKGPKTAGFIMVGRAGCPSFIHVYVQSAVHPPKYDDDDGEDAPFERCFLRTKWPSGTDDFSILRTFDRSRCWRGGG